MCESLRGQFLIAAKGLRDPNFFKTVVLVVEHNSQGAMGLVVNRPTTVTVAHALSKHFNLPETDDLVYVGGPVEPNALFVLHNAPEFEQEDAMILPDLFVGSSADVFESVVRAAAEGGADFRFRIFSGCAGWAPGQLEAEIGRGDWYHEPATVDMILGEDPYEVWDAMLKRVYESHRILPHPPNDPQWN